MKHKNKILFGTIILVFILLTTPVFANVINNEMSTKIENNNYYDDYEKQIYDIEYLTFLVFKTIIDFSKNEDFLKLIDINGYNFEIKENDFTHVYRKMIMEKPMIIISLLKTKPTISENYLGFIYEKGIEISNILDESEINSLIDSIKINNKQTKEEIKDTILSNSELYKNIKLINDLTNNCNCDNTHNSNELPLPEEGPPIICFILFCICFPFYLYASTISVITNRLITPPIAYIIMIITSGIAYSLNCDWNYWD